MDVETTRTRRWVDFGAIALVVASVGTGFGRAYLDAKFGMTHGEIAPVSYLDGLFLVCLTAFGVAATTTIALGRKVRGSLFYSSRGVIFVTAIANAILAVTAKIYV